MSTPSDPTGDVPEVPAAPEVPSAPSVPSAPEGPADAQPTEAYPTQAYPTEAYPADAQPTEAYPAPTAAPVAAPPTSPAPYGAPTGYPQAYAAPLATAPDTRSKRLAWAALGSAIVGFLLVLVGFLPLPWVGLVAVGIGGLLLFVAFILSIVALVKKSVGGTGLSITALVVSVIGGIVGVFALFVALAFGLIASGNISTGSSPAPIESVQPDDETDAGVDDGTDDGVEDGTDDGTASEGEAAFIAEVRPQVNEILAEVDPSLTPEIVESIYSDETLVLLGQTLLLTGESGLDMYTAQVVEGSDGVFADDQARRLLEVLFQAAEKHLQD